MAKKEEWETQNTQRQNAVKSVSDYRGSQYLKKKGTAICSQQEDSRSGGVEQREKIWEVRNSTRSTQERTNKHKHGVATVTAHQQESLTHPARQRERASLLDDISATFLLGTVAFLFSYSCSWHCGYTWTAAYATSDLIFSSGKTQKKKKEEEI